MSERMLNGVLGAVVLSLLFFAFRDSVPDPVRRLIPGIRPAHAAAARPATSPTPARAADRPHRRNGRALPENATSASGEPVPVRDIVVPLPPSPTAADIRPSMSRGELVDKFGPPDLSATWSEAGKMNEKLIYQTGRSAVAVTVQNGRVVGRAGE